MEKELLQELEFHHGELELQNEELRRAQRELEAGLERFAQLFDFAPIGYARLTPEGIVTDLNHTGATLLRTHRSHIVQRRFGLFVAESNRTQFNDFLAQVFAQDTRRTAEFELDLQLPRERPRARLTATKLAGGAPTILLAFEDITAEKRAEELKRESEAAKLAEQQLREADHRKDEFLAVLSHELRTPLTTILVHGQLLQHHADPKIRNSGEVIERAARTQTRLVEDLLDVSSVVAGKLTVDKRPSDLADVVRAAVRSVEGDARKKKILLTADIDPAIPPVFGDPVRLEQAVLNLLTNAIKFTAEAGRIDVKVANVEGEVCVEVRDNGQGIDPAFLSHVFEKFRQADSSTTRMSGGLGLGLSIVRAIVEAHGGMVRVESGGLGKGATFYLSLPVPRRWSDSTHVVVRDGATPRLDGRRLLVVDDDTDTLETVSRVLELAGAEVRQANSAASALETLKHFEPDLMVCDVAMPREDGCSLLGRIRSQGQARTMRTVALTALAGEQDRARTAAAGFDAHLVKPIDMETLLDAVSRLLHRGAEPWSAPRSRRGLSVRKKPSKRRS